jgi:hypothetical protein
MADVVHGSRFVGGKLHQLCSSAYCSQILTSLSNALLTNLTDMETCYKVFNVFSKWFSHLFSRKGFGFEPEIIRKISRVQS